MSPFAKLLILAALSAPPWGQAAAEPRTVCSITVNSPDEQAVFRVRLPADSDRFVELVERGRPDAWTIHRRRSAAVRKIDVMRYSVHKG